MNDLKRCPKCNEEKPRAEFHRNKRMRDGLQVHCKRCHYAHNTNWRKANPDKWRSYSSEWSRHNPEAKLTQKARRRAVTRNAEQATCPRERAAIRAMYGLAPLVSWLLGEEVAVDHRVPLAAGGTNRLDNLCFLPARINAMKGAKLDHEWDGELLAYLVVNNHT